MDVGAWLSGLGLSQYEAAFRDNAIDGTVLPSLTADDLKDLGVVLVGHRRKLLDAVAALRTDATVRAGHAEALGDPAGDAAERRQVTVMFSDLVGSTALSGRMDPEDLRDLLSAYRRCVRDVVSRHDGYVAKYLGDGALVYFGYPQAREDDAERAVRAGLELIAAVATVAGGDRNVPLQSRVGIATGLVIVGDLIGSGEAQERGIVGETPNLAARLQAVAEPDMVVIADDTRRLVGDLFELQDLGARDLKGIKKAVRAWATLRLRPIESRFEALRGRGPTALVGRTRETGLLARCWADAKAGNGHVVLLSGEAGIGKSRLTAALLDSLDAEPHARLRYFCSPQHTDSALRPIIGQMERAAGLAREDTPQTKLDKLDALLARTSTPAADAALFADMLSMPSDGRYPPAEPAPAQRRQQTLEALVRQLEALARAKPVLIIFEDAHWADPTSLEALGWMIDRLADLRVLLIVTSRPEFEPPWSGQPHVTSLALDRLPRPDIELVIDRIVGNAALPADVRQDIIERTDGIPLFVEEMTKAVLEAGDEAGALRTAAAVPARASAVPATLHASLMARLDRLGAAREIAQIGAAIGREFSWRLLVTVARRPEAELASSLDRLVTAGLLFRQGGPPDPTFLFKHALVQDAAYGALLREPRRTLHARIAEAIENHFPDVAESRPELLARHCTEAGLIENAAGLWARAGRRSLARSALREAAEQIARALDQIATLPATAVSRREAIRLQVELANALIHTKGHAAPETQASFMRAHELIEQAEAMGEPPEDPLMPFSVLYGFWVANRVALKGDVARRLAAQFLARAQERKAAGALVIGHLVMGISLVITGDFVDGREHLDRAITLYDPDEHRALATQFAHDARVSAFSWRAIALWALGHPEAALADVEHALRDARDIGHAATTMYGLSHTTLTLIACGRAAAADASIDELTVLADEKRTLFWKAYAMLLRGQLLSLAGKAAEAVPMMTSGIAAMRSTGATTYAPWYMSILARAHAQLGAFDEAWRCIGEAMDAVQATDERWCESDLHRVAGDIALMSPDPDTMAAEEHFERALALARRQHAKSWELHAATAIARLWRMQGKSQQAHDLLAPIERWFSACADIPDGRRAAALAALPMRPR
jgi:class 3 adenylate cyclase/predicted ATPase